MLRHSRGVQQFRFPKNKREKRVKSFTFPCSDRTLYRTTANRLPSGEAQPVEFSVHGAIAKHYGIDEDKLPASHAATLDYIQAAAGG
jgi:hypothetical protein